MMSRRQKLEGLLKDDPEDPFLHYALANEILKEGETSSGIEMLQSLINNHPDYVAAYFRVGQVLAEAGDPQSARTALTNGIAVAGRVGDDHAAGEMAEFLGMLDE